MTKIHLEAIANLKPSPRTVLPPGHYARNNKNNNISNNCSLGASPNCPKFYQKNFLTLSISLLWFPWKLCLKYV